MSIEAAGPKITAGFFSFTEITDPAEHRSYNEWHQLDHLPEQLTLRGIGGGERWVASPACRQVRAVAAAPFDAAHYVTLYLLAPPLAATLAEFAALAVELRAADRFHLHRRAVVSGAFDRVGSIAAPRVSLSASAVPHRKNLGVHVRVDEVEGPGARADHLRWIVADHLPRLAGTPGVAGSWAFQQRSSGTDLEARVEHRVVTVTWLDAPPVEVAARIGALPVAPGTARTVLDSPFEHIEPFAWGWFDPPHPVALTKEPT